MTKNILFAFLLNSFLVQAQIIQRAEITLPYSSPYSSTDNIYQVGTAIAKLDSNCFAVGGEIVYSTQALQTRTAEQLFICKVDSQFNFLWTDTFEYYGDYNPSHSIQNIFPSVDTAVVFNADALIYGYDSLTYQFFSTINKHSLSGTRIWTKPLYPPPSNLNITVTSAINYNDTFLVAGRCYNINTGNSFPVLAGFNIAGDTIFMNDYSSFVYSQCFDETKIFQDLQNNLYLTVSCNSSNTHYILKIDQTGNVLSIDSIALGWSSIDFLFITPNRFLVYGYNQLLTFFDGAHNVIDSFSVPRGFYKFYALPAGNVLALFDTYFSNTIIPDGYYALRFDSMGQFSGGLRYSQALIPEDVLNAITPINDSTFIGTGQAFSGNYLDNAVILKFSVQRAIANLTTSSTNICGNDSVVISAPNGNIFKWSTGDTLQQITVTQPGDYFASVINSSGTLMFTDTVHILNYPAPNLSLGNDTTLCITQSILLEGGNNLSNYIWQDSSATQTFLASSITADTIFYSVQVTDTNGCSANDTIEVIFDICAGINSLDEKHFLSVSPNPFTNKVLFHPLITSTETISIHLFNSIGEKVLERETTLKEQEINLSTLQSGIYFLTIHSESIFTALKIVKL
ncbi:MAG: T9SS type A sorting domain-containing protein [Bacteroidota bacterium]